MEGVDVLAASHEKNKVFATPLTRPFQHHAIYSRTTHSTLQSKKTTNTDLR